MSTPIGPTVGIEKIWAYPGSLSLDLRELAVARGKTAQYVENDLLLTRRSVNPLWEDPVTMAVNAADPMLSDDDRAAVELIIVATESSVDQGKAMSTFAQRHLGIGANCRNYESKHACYGCTAALMMAAHWVVSGVAPGKKALVIATDQSREHIGQPYEYVMGAGAVAMLVSDQPDVLALELPLNGFWTREVSDTFRPTSTVETGNGETSLYCYIDALEGAYEHYCQRAGEFDFDERFAANLYHVPFGGLTFQAHRTLLRRWKRMKKSAAWEHFNRKSRPALRYNAEVGGTYSGSTFLALMGLLDSRPDLSPGDRISIFAYGSGSCGEFYSGVLGPKAHQRVAEADVQGLIDARRPLTVDQYETLERARQSLIDRGTYVPGREGLERHWRQHYEGKGLLVYRGIEDYYRDYGRS